MDPKEVFERRARRGVGPMEPAPEKPGAFESVEAAVLDRLPVPIRDGLPRAIDFRRRTQSWFSFPYHCLMGMEYLPHSRLVLTFSTHTVALSGRNLGALYKAIRDQTMEKVEEMDRATRLSGVDEGPEIDAIEVCTLGEGTEPDAPRWGEIGRVSDPSPSE